MSNRDSVCLSTCDASVSFNNKAGDMGSSFVLSSAVSFIFFLFIYSSASINRMNECLFYSFGSALAIHFPCMNE